MEKRKQIKKEENQNKCLPETIIFEILCRLPADFLLKYGTKVCQKWADLINNPSFIRSHSSHSRTGLLVQRSDFLYLKFFQVNAGELVLKREPSNSLGKVLSTCRGIILFCLSWINFSFCAANTVTKQRIQLPSARLPSGHPICAALGYDYSLEEFKVICFSKDSDEALSWLFFTIGKDEDWRKVDVGSFPISIESLADRRWISAGGIIYGVHKERNITAVDVGHESTWIVNVPEDKEETIGGYCGRENRLTCISHGREETTLRVYRLDDFRKSAWTNIYKFTLQPSDHHLINGSHSLAWVENGKILLLKQHSSPEIWGYDVRTRSCKVLSCFPVSIRFFEMSRTLIRL